MAATTQQPVDAAPVRRGWWRRNWKRLIGGLLVAAVSAGGGIWYHFCGRVFFSEPYKLAWAEVQKNKLVIAELGEPIGGGWAPHGMIENDTNIPEASMNFTISGPKGTGDVAALARFIDGSWGFPRFEVTAHPLNGSAADKRLDLAAGINAGKPDGTPVFNATDNSRPAVTTKEATPDQNITIPDLDPPPAGK